MVTAAPLSRWRRRRPRPAFGPPHRLAPGPAPRPHRPAQPDRRRGFTTIELVLATLLGSVLVVAVLAVLGLIQRADTVLGTQHRQSLEVANTQLVVRRAFNNLVLTGEPSTRSRDAQEVINPNDQPDEDEDDQNETGDDADADAPTDTDEELVDTFGRIVLNADDRLQLEDIRLGVLDARPQRLELVTRTSPVPESLAGFSSDDLPSAAQLGESFTETNGGVRGVFELRPDGAREAFMQRFGWEPIEPFNGNGRPNPEIVDPDGDGEERLTWTLWYRPVTAEELLERQTGLSPTPARHAARLASAFRLVTGLVYCRWMIFDGRQRLDQFEIRSAQDVPGFCELELLNAQGLYANYLFEPGWVVADDIEPQEAEEGAEDGADGETVTPAPPDSDPPTGGAGGGAT